MGTWGELLKELGELKRKHNGAPPSPPDQLRRKYLAALSQHTGRATIVYATCWLEGRDAPPASMTVNLGDQQGFMEAVSNVEEDALDLILTSPGGSPEAAEAIMEYLRTRFDNIRAIVPVAAMSAATMMALACDEILMGAHSQLGPIDPQFTIQTPEGPRTAPGQAILDQWELGKLECRDPKNLGAWLPLLRALAPGLITQCKHQRALAEEFAARQLEAHMFRGDPDAAKKAAGAAAWFADFSSFKSHGRRVSRDDARGQHLRITNLEDDNVLQDLALSVHHAVRHTFNDTATVKLIENHHGRCYIEMVGQLTMPIPMPAPGLGRAPKPGISPPVLPGLAPARPAPSPSRNAPCPCGSGRKYKLCHGGPNPPD